MIKSFSIILSVVFSALLVAQVQKEPTYLDILREKVSRVEPARRSQNKEQLSQLSAEFLELATTEKKDWLPYYYASYLLILKGQILVQENKNNEIEDVAYYAQKPLYEAKKLSPDNAEILVLQKLIYQLEKHLKPSQIYQNGGPMAVQLVSQMRQKFPKNPRVTLLIGEDLMLTPKQFGGDPEKGIEQLRKALEQFKTFKPESSLHPNWGKEIAEKLLLDAKK